MTCIDDIDVTKNVLLRLFYHDTPCVSTKEGMRDMEFSFPRACNWILHKRNKDGSYTLKDCLYGGKYTLGSNIGFLWRNLDGRTDPADILPKCSKHELSSMMNALDQKGLIRHNRILERTHGSIAYSLFIPKNRTRESVLSIIMNYLLMTLWFPSLLLGSCLFICNLDSFDSKYLLLGQLLGLLVGCISHEGGHATAGLAYGARFLEAGILTQHRFLSGAYVLLDDSPVNKRLHKVQINAAGVEMNFLIAGLAFVLAATLANCAGFFLGFAIINLFLGLINLTFINSLDGMHIIENLLGYEPLEVIKNKSMRKSLRNQGFPGKLELYICYTLQIMQLVYPALIVLNVLEVVLWAISIASF